MMMFARDAGRTAGVGGPDVSEAERRLAGMVKTGKVTAVDYADTSKPRVRVGIGDEADDEGYIETDWLPIKHGRSNEWNPLKVGEWVEVSAEAGDLANATVGHALHTEDNPAPGNRADLYRKTFANGGMVEYDEAAGAMALKAPTSILAQVQPQAEEGGDPPPAARVFLETDKVTVAFGDNASIVLEEGKITLKAGDTQYVLDGSTHAFTGGDATFDADVTAEGTVTGQTDVIAASISGKGHHHTDPQGGSTGPPS